MGNGDISMILGFEDVSIIFALLTPVYYLAWLNNVRLNKIETRIEIIECKEMKT
jgi:hypothetical protein